MPRMVCSIVTPLAKADVALPATWSSVIFSKNAFLTETGRGGELHHKLRSMAGTTRMVAQAYNPFPRMLDGDLVGGVHTI